MHTWWTWLGLWMGRLVAEISFMALIGRMVGDEAVVNFLLVGAALLAPAYATMFLAQSVRSFARDGLIPYFIAAPGPVFPAALGRSVHWSADGVAGGCLGLVVGNLIFGLDVTIGQLFALLGLIAVCPVALVGVGLSLGAAAHRWPSISNTLSGLARGLLGLLCGATFATSHLPEPLQIAGDLLPLTHLVRVARGVTGDGVAWADVGWTTVTGLAWLALAVVLVSRQFSRARVTGNTG